MDTNERLSRKRPSEGLPMDDSNENENSPSSNLFTRAISIIFSSNKKQRLAPSSSNTTSSSTVREEQKIKSEISPRLTSPLPSLNLDSTRLVDRKTPKSNEVTNNGFSSKGSFIVSTATSKFEGNNTPHHKFSRKMSNSRSMELMRKHSIGTFSIEEKDDSFKSKSLQSFQDMNLLSNRKITSRFRERRRNSFHRKKLSNVHKETVDRILKNGEGIFFPSRPKASDLFTLNKEDKRSELKTLNVNVIGKYKVGGSRLNSPSQPDKLYFKPPAKTIQSFDVQDKQLKTFTSQSKGVRFNDIAISNLQSSHLKKTNVSTRVPTPALKKSKLSIPSTPTLNASHQSVKSPSLEEAASQSEDDEYSCDVFVITKKDDYGFSGTPTHLIPTPTKSESPYSKQVTQCENKQKNSVTFHFTTPDKEIMRKKQRKICRSATPYVSKTKELYTVENEMGNSSLAATTLKAPSTDKSQSKTMSTLCGEGKKETEEGNADAKLSKGSFTWGANMFGNPDEWKCNECYVRNPKDADKCTSCTAPRANKTVQTKSNNLKTTPQHGKDLQKKSKDDVQNEEQEGSSMFNFSMGKGNASTGAIHKNGFSFGAPTQVHNDVAPTTGFSLGFQPEVKKEDTPSQGFTFGAKPLAQKMDGKTNMNSGTELASLRHEKSVDNLTPKSDGRSTKGLESNDGKKEARTSKSNNMFGNPGSESGKGFSFSSESFGSMPTKTNPDNSVQISSNPLDIAKVTSQPLTTPQTPGITMSKTAGETSKFSFGSFSKPSEASTRSATQEQTQEQPKKKRTLDSSIDTATENKERKFPSFTFGGSNLNTLEQKRTSFSFGSDKATPMAGNSENVPSVAFDSMKKAGEQNKNSTSFSFGSTPATKDAPTMPAAPFIFGSIKSKDEIKTTGKGPDSNISSIPAAQSANDTMKGLPTAPTPSKITFATKKDGEGQQFSSNDSKQGTPSFAFGGAPGSFAATPSGFTFGSNSNNTTQPTPQFGNNGFGAQNQGKFGMQPQTNTPVSGAQFSAPSGFGSQATTPANGFGSQGTTPANGFGPQATTPANNFGPQATTPANNFGPQATTPANGFGSQGFSSGGGGFAASTGGFGSNSANTFGSQAQSTPGTNGFQTQLPTSTGGFGSQPTPVTNGFGSQPAPIANGFGSQAALATSGVSTGFGNQAPGSMNLPTGGGFTIGTADRRAGRGMAPKRRILKARRPPSSKPGK